MLSFLRLKIISASLFARLIIFLKVVASGTILELFDNGMSKNGISLINMSTSWYSLRFAAFFPPIRLTVTPLANLGLSILGASSSFRFFICSLKLNQFSPRVLSVF